MMTGPSTPAPPYLRRELALYPVDVGVLFGTPAGERSLQQLETAPAVAACGALVLGSALCLFGARFEKRAALLCAFLDGAVLVSLALAQLRVLPDGGVWVGAVSWGCFVLGGFLLASVTLADAMVARFVVGGTAGALLALVSRTILGLWSPRFALIAVVAAACGLLAVKLERPAMVAATSWIGATAMVWGAAYFVGNYPLSDAMREGGQHPRERWGYAASAFVCCAIGCVAQQCGEKASRARHTPSAYERYERLETPRSRISTARPQY